MLGVGGAGSSVWVAYDPKRDERVALKLLLTNDSQEQARFERGAILAASLQHPNIARVYEHGKDGELAWVSMELLAGETLATRLSVSKAVTPKVAVALADQVLAALEHAHAGEIVHRDLKPANLFITPASADGSTPEQVLILDFGIARLVGPSAAERFGPFFPDDDPIAPELEGEVTGEHRICGTPEYMAPEQILGGEPDIRSDFYALGIILYRMVGGQLPFRARTRYEVYHRHLHETAPPLPPVVMAPIAFVAVLQRAMSKDPSARFGNAAEMRSALRASVGMVPVKRHKLFPTEFELRAVPEPAAFGQLPTHPVGISPLPLAPSPVSTAAASERPAMVVRSRRSRVVYSALSLAALILALVAYLTLTRSDNDGATSPVKSSVSNTSSPTRTVPPGF